MTSRTLHVHGLEGCRPTPLASYLKGLAILRLVAEQADPGVRGWWADESFHLATSLNREELERFFLYRYSPTPLLAPWNGGSGFYPKDNRKALDAIAASVAPRLDEYRRGIAAATALAGGRDTKPDADAKRALLRACRRSWREGLLHWFNAAVVLDANGEPATYPALLGTGGNDGRLDFTNNFMQRIVRLIDCRSAEGAPASSAPGQLRAALYGHAAPALEDGPVGMFLPGAGGGPNSGPGFSGRSAANPWDYVLMLEGCLCFASALTERARVGDAGAASAPFAVSRQLADSAGYGSAAAEADSRGEQWMPLWTAPARFIEVQAMFAEGRRQVGRFPARSSVDIARATARLGVARGVTSFERYGFFERNGQAFVAVPLGRWRVRAESYQGLLDQIQGWSAALARAAGASGAPQGVVVANRRCREATMACCQDASNRGRWQELLIAMGSAEQVLARSVRFAADNRIPLIPRLDAQWLEAADDGSPEFDLAAAFASQAMRGDRGQWDPRASIRTYFVPTDDGRSFSEAADAPLAGHEILATCATTLVARVLVDAHGSQGSVYPLLPGPCAGASLAAIGAFLRGDTDDVRILALARALMAVDWRSGRDSAHRGLHWSPTPSMMAFALFRLAYAPFPIGQGEVQPRTDPAILQRLMRGDLAGSTSLAIRRLQHAGIRPLADMVVGSGIEPGRIAAALVFGLDRSRVDRLARFAAEVAFTPEPKEVFS